MYLITGCAENWIEEKDSEGHLPGNEMDSLCKAWRAKNGRKTRDEVSTVSKDEPQRTLSITLRSFTPSESTEEPL